tara:strand:- start:10 stop:303 length:294 start_codon:yes stop_codon:yes gene_type:complete
MTDLTSKETAMIVAFIKEGKECTDAQSAEDMLHDNMSWMSATDLCKTLGWNKQEVGGVMSALSDKGLIHDSGESAREAQDTDWYASDEAIEKYFDFA